MKKEGKIPAFTSASSLGSTSRLPLPIRMNAITGSSTMTSVFGNIDLLSHILRYTISHTNEIPAIATTCRQFDDVLNRNIETSSSIWQSICTVQHPDIVPVYDLCKESLSHRYVGGGGWKALLRRATTSNFKPRGGNKELQKKFECVFKEEGIVAYWEESYENYADFTLREHGINSFGFDFRFGAVFILHAQVRYRDYQYLLENWDTECDIIRRWCAVMGVAESGYTAEKPVSKNACVIVRFEDPYALEEYMSNDEDDNDNFELYEYDLVEGSDGFGSDGDDVNLDYDHEEEADEIDYDDMSERDGLNYNDMDERDYLDYPNSDADYEVDEYQM
jgi:hypothetical protein